MTPQKKDSAFRTVALCFAKALCYYPIIKMNMTKAKAPPWLSQMKKPLRLCSTAHLRMAAKQSTAFFVEAIGPVNDSAKKRKGRNEPSGKRQDSGLPEQGVKGEAIPIGRVKRRQLLIWVQGRSIPA